MCITRARVAHIAGTTGTTVVILKDLLIMPTGATLYIGTTTVVPRSHSGAIHVPPRARGTTDDLTGMIDLTAWTILPSPLAFARG